MNQGIGTDVVGGTRMGNGTEMERNGNEVGQRLGRGAKGRWIRVITMGSEKRNRNGK